MNSLRAHPGGRLAGSMTVPGDKSISHRAVMLAALGDGPSRISGFLNGEDCLATLAAMQAMGVRVDVHGDTDVLVHGVGMRGLSAPPGPLDLGNSGTAMRLMAGLLSAQSFATTLIGDESLMSRPMERVAAPLRMMGAQIDTDDGRPPIRTHAASALQGIDYKLPVASAQVKSAILLAGLYADGTTQTHCPGVTRDHTERMLAALGADIQVDGLSVTLCGPATLSAHDWAVPGDFSSAAFFIVAALLCAEGTFEIRDVGLNPTRIGLLNILRDMGGAIDIVDQRDAGGEPVGTLRIRRSELRGVHVSPDDVASAIDEFPIVFVAASLARGRTVLRGAEELRHKETDRIAVMAKALSAVGADVTEYPDGIDIEGGSLTGGRVDARGDHRVAMAMSVAAQCAGGPIDIAGAAQVATSFPGFVATAQSAGMRVDAADA